MAGHSKWANIRRRQGALHSNRGKIFSKLIREIAIAARAAGADSSKRSSLRLAVERALDSGVPADSIEGTVSCAAGESCAHPLHRMRFEGYGPGGTAVLVD